MESNLFQLQGYLYENFELMKMASIYKIIKGNY